MFADPLLKHCPHNPRKPNQSMLITIMNKWAYLNLTIIPQIKNPATRRGLIEPEAFHTKNYNYLFKRASAQI